MGYEAKVILDSVSERGDRLTTVEATYPRFIHSELLTHRALSRNSASSRAVPITTFIERVLEDPVYPLEWGTKKAGMQAGPALDEHAAVDAMIAWDRARFAAVAAAPELKDLDVHKQVVNRLLEPFLWHTVIYSGTAAGWENFFRQRSRRFTTLAQPEMLEIADMILEAYEASTPVFVKEGEWHTPYIQEDEAVLSLDERKQISVARCARVSYLTHNGVRDLGKDLELFERLVNAEPPHASPLEHVATPAVGALGNFDGWAQFRHLVGR